MNWYNSTIYKKQDGIQWAILTENRSKNLANVLGEKNCMKRRTKTYKDTDNSLVNGRRRIG
jgi:hypothetical protein